MKRLQHLPFYYLAIAYVIFILIGSRVLSEWGNWYSSSPHLRNQVDALLNGDLALSNSASDLSFDLAWSEGGVQQVWGLGVPLWRLPFVVLARLAGMSDFPDMLAFAIALAITAYFIFRTFSPNSPNTETSNKDLWIQRLNFFGVTSIILFFPPFLTLLRSRFEVYEEIIAYEYMFGLISLCGLIHLTRKTNRRRFVLLCFWAGFGGLVRPTLVFYGFATVVTGMYILVLKEINPTKRARVWVSIRRYSLPCIGGLLFCFGGGILFITNLQRFGNGFEFGHKLNLQDLTSLSYTTHFTAPYEREPLPTAAREMFGVLFLVKNTNRGDYNREHFFPMQSPTIRWRDMYLRTYDLSYFGFLVAGTLAGLFAYTSNRSAVGNVQSYSSRSPITVVIVFWSWIALILLGAFYLRSPLISSRYLLDFMPAFVALLIAGWRSLMFLCMSKVRGLLLSVSCTILLLSWLFFQIFFLSTANGPPRMIDSGQVSLIKHPFPSKQRIKPLPDCYKLSDDLKMYGIPYNGTGWDLNTGVVKPEIILFVESPNYIELDIAMIDEATRNIDVNDVRVKIGLEYLTLESAKQENCLWKMRFGKPQSVRYQHGIQSLFIAFTPDTKMAYETTPFKLIKVQWSAVSEFTTSK